MKICSEEALHSSLYEAEGRGSDKVQLSLSHWEATDPGWETGDLLFVQHFHFIGEKSKAQRGWATFPRSHS